MSGPEQRPLRIIQVGCGGISHLWLEKIRTTSQLSLAAIVDVDAGAARAALQNHELDAPVFTSYKEAFRGIEADIVFDCTPPPFHFSVTCSALRAGLHVFGEKPMAEGISDALKMIDAARAADRTYAVMQNRRFDPNIRTLREFIKTDVIGKITTVNSDFYLSPHFGGFRDEMRNVLLKDMAIHTFDAARFLMGASSENVFCHEWNPSGSWYAHGASAVAIFNMQNDGVFTYRGSWCSEGLHTNWEAGWRIIGERGSITWDGAKGLRCQIGEPNDAFIYEQIDIEVPELCETKPDSWHGLAIQNFCDAVANNTTPETICSDNICSLAMVIGAVESAKVGQKTATSSMETVQ